MFKLLRVLGESRSLDDLTKYHESFDEIDNNVIINFFRVSHSRPFLVSKVRESETSVLKWETRVVTQLVVLKRDSKLQVSKKLKVIYPC